MSHPAHLLVSTIGTQPAEPLSRARTSTAVVGGIVDILPSASSVVWAGAVARPAATWRQDALASFAPSPALPFLLWIDILPMRTVRGIVVSTQGLMIFHKHDIRKAEGPATRADIVHEVARDAARAIAQNDTRRDVSARDDSADVIQFSDDLSKRIAALALLEPVRFPPPRLPLRRTKVPRDRPKPPKIFWIASRHADKAVDIEFENLDLLLAGTPHHHLRPPEGRRGFPTYAEIPRLIVGKNRKRRPPRDLEEYHDYWLVSDRLKALFEAIDPDAFAFQACDVRWRDGSPGPQLWLCDVVRTLDAIDDETAKVVDHYYERIGPRGSHFSMREELCFQQSRIGDAHISERPTRRRPSFVIST